MTSDCFFHKFDFSHPVSRLFLSKIKRQKSAAQFTTNNIGLTGLKPEKNISDSRIQVKLFFAKKCAEILMRSALAEKNHPEE
jgi:hypothetical protein